MKNCRVLLCCVAISLFLFGCSKQAKINSEHTESVEQNAVAALTEEVMDINTYANIKITLDDGTEIPFTTRGFAKSIDAMEQSTVYLDFLQNKPDSVSAALTPYYSGGQALTGDSTDVTLEQISETQYTLLLPVASDYMITIFDFLRYEINALYADGTYIYHFTVQLQPAPVL